MTRKDLLTSPEYWHTMLQLQLFNKVQKYLQNNNMTRADFAKQLNVSKGYVTQLLNGDYDNRLSKFVELLLQIGYVPKLEFVPIEDMLSHDGELLNEKSTKISLDSNVNLSKNETKISAEPTQNTNQKRISVKRQKKSNQQNSQKQGLA